MDDLDHKIIQLLSENARMPVKDIAQKVSLTSPAVSSRIHRLEQEGIIGGYTVVLRNPSAPARVEALISVLVDAATRASFLAMIEQESQVLQCFRVTGSYNFIIKVSCTDIDALEHLLTKMQKMGSTNTGPQSGILTKEDVMYFCKNCGRLAHPGEDRCPKCGAAHIQPAPAATAPTGPAAPQYHPAEDAPEQDVPALGFGSTLGTLVIFAIPLVGFIMMLVWSFSGGPDSARKRLARAYLVRTLIIAVIFALLFLIGALSLATVSHSLYYALR